MRNLNFKFEITYPLLQRCYLHQSWEIRHQVQCSMKYALAAKFLILNYVELDSTVH